MNALTATDPPKSPAPPVSEPLSDIERDRVLLEGMENKLNSELLPLRTFVETAGPALESLKVSQKSLSDDYKVLAGQQKLQADDMRRMAENSVIAAASGRSMAEHVGVLIGHMARLDGRIGTVEARSQASETRIEDMAKGQKAAVEATDKELASLRTALAENRSRIIEIVKDDPRITTPDEITAIRKLPPVATALEQQLAQLQIDRAKKDAELDHERRKDEIEDERIRRKQRTIAWGKILKVTAQAAGIIILGLALWAAGRYFGFKAGQQETMEHRP